MQYLGEARLLMQALRASRRKIIVFLLVVLILVTIFGSLIYLIEDPKDGFTSIPKSIYWSIVTLTTVGYGDISPKTNLGQAALSSDYDYRLWDHCSSDRNRNGRIGTGLWQKSFNSGLSGMQRRRPRQ